MKIVDYEHLKEMKESVERCEQIIKDIKAEIKDPEYDHMWQEGNISIITLLKKVVNDLTESIIEYEEANKSGDSRHIGD